MKHDTPLMLPGTMDLAYDPGVVSALVSGERYVEPEQARPKAGDRITVDGQQYVFDPGPTEPDDSYPAVEFTPWATRTDVQRHRFSEMVARAVDFHGSAAGFVTMYKGQRRTGALIDKAMALAEEWANLVVDAFAAQRTLKDYTEFGTTIKFVNLRDKNPEPAYLDGLDNEGKRLFYECVSRATDQGCLTEFLSRFADMVDDDSYSPLVALAEAAKAYGAHSALETAERGLEGVHYWVGRNWKEPTHES